MTDRSLWDYNVGVFCHNEQSRIGACLDSIATAASGSRTLVTLVLNGSTDGSAAEAIRAAKARRLPILVYAIRHADKSNAINRFIHELRAESATCVFVDAYARISETSLSSLAGALEADPAATAASGVAINGRTMRHATLRTLSRGGVLHGQLYALRRAFLDRMVAAGVKLPVNLYRGDGLLGSMAAHDLDAVHEPWIDARIRGVSKASYEIASLSPLRLTDVKRHLRRKVRQMRGVLENSAIRQIIYTHGYTGLPTDADEMIADFLHHSQPPLIGLIDRPFMLLALKAHRAAKRVPEADLVPTLVDKTADINAPPAAISTN